jgi:hypothetical protein
VTAQLAASQVELNSMESSHVLDVVTVFSENILTTIIFLVTGRQASWVFARNT